MDISRRVRKVFIGNIPRDAPEMTPEYLLAFFTEAMTAANLIDPERSGPMIIWAFIEQRTKGFGFIEFRTLAEAESVYALNGIELLGQAARH